MVPIKNEDRQRVIDFIKNNELDYNIDNTEYKFNIIAYDGIIFTFYIYQEKYIIVKYNRENDKPDNPYLTAYDYFQFETLPLALEQVKYYDDNLQKSYWEVTTNSAEIGFDKGSYKSDWYEEFTKDAEYSMVNDDDLGYKYLSYNNPKYSPNIKSPYNKLSEIPEYSDQSPYIQVNKLYFEIHPISCRDGQESYLFKLLANNEEILKEYINYIVSTKKGLKLLIEEIFKNIKK